MSKSDILHQYQKDVENIRLSAKNLGLSDEDFNKLVNESFDDINEQKCSNLQAQKWLKRISGVMIFFIFVYIMLNVNQTTSSIVLRNVQGLIYPGMKLVRFLSVPIIKIFPGLTDFYDESCLVENPYFFVSDLDCTPCKSAYSVIDLTNVVVDDTFQSDVPFITKTNQQPITLTYLQEYLKNNQKTTFEDSRRFSSNNNSINTLNKLINTPEHTLKTLNFHATWKINKMNTARLIRTIFPRPNFISKWSGQSVERFVIVDSSKSDRYLLPNTECSYVFIVQAYGQRTIVLKPAKECKNDCKTLSVVLKQSYVLSYNWWYWRPISLPMENSTDTSITYLNSYC